MIVTGKVMLNSDEINEAITDYVKKKGFEIDKSKSYTWGSNNTISGNPNHVYVYVEVKNDSENT